MTEAVLVAVILAGGTFLTVLLKRPSSSCVEVDGLDFRGWHSRVIVQVKHQIDLGIGTPFVLSPRDQTFCSCSAEQ